MGNKYEQNADVIQGNQGPDGKVEIVNNSTIVINSTTEISRSEFQDLWGDCLNELLVVLSEAKRDGHLVEHGIDYIDTVQVLSKIQSIAPCTKDEAMHGLNAHIDPKEKESTMGFWHFLLKMQYPVLQGIQSNVIYDILKLWVGV